MPIINTKPPVGSKLFEEIHSVTVGIELNVDCNCRQSKANTYFPNNRSLTVRFAKNSLQGVNIFGLQELKEQPNQLLNLEDIRSIEKIQREILTKLLEVPYEQVSFLISASALNTLKRCLNKLSNLHSSPFFPNNFIFIQQSFSTLT